MRRIFCIALSLVLSITAYGCTRHEESCKIYKVEKMNDKYCFTDGNAVYKPIDDSNWHFYNYRDEPVGRTVQGRAVLGFEHDPETLFIQEQKGLFSDMETRVYQRTDVVLPELSESSLSNGDRVFLSVFGKTTELTEPNIPDEILMVHLNSDVNENSGIQETYRCIGTIMLCFQRFEQCYYNIYLFQGEESRNIGLYNADGRIVNFEQNSEMEKLLATLMLG